MFPDLLVGPNIATMSPLSSPLSPETSDGRRRKNNRKEEDGEDGNIATVLHFDDDQVVGDNSRSRSSSSSSNSKSNKERLKKREKKKEVVTIQGPVSKFHKNREAIMTATTANAYGILPNYHTTELQDDHPTSLHSDTIRTHRTCGLCERLLPRSQFSMSAANAGIVNVALSPGSVTCRTCTMTVCAVQLKCLPTLNTMLDGYAQRGMAMLTTGANGSDSNNTQQQQQQQQRLSNGRSAPIAGLLQSSNHSSSELTTTTTRGALVISEREENNHNTVMADVNTVFDGNSVSNSGNIDRTNNVADCKYIDLLLCIPSYLNLSAFGIFTASSEISMSVAALEAVRLYGTLLGGGGGDNSNGGRGYFVPHDCDGKPVKRNVNNESTADDPRSVVCLVIGEGPIPRTAILASTHYGWTTVAIDASLSSQWTGQQVDVPDFVGYAGTFHDFMKFDRRRDNGSSDTRFGYPRDNVPIRHLVIITIQPNDKCNPVRMTNYGHINEIRSLYDDAPTTVISLSPVLGVVNPLAPHGAAERKKYLHEKNGLERDLGYAPNCFYVDNGIFSECREIKVWNFHNIDDEDDDDGDSIDDDDQSEEDNNNDDYDYGDDTADVDKRNEDQLGRLGGRRKGALTTEKHDNKASKNQGQIKGGKSKPTMKSFKRNDWLEKQVTNFMNESFATTNNSDSHTLDDVNTSQDDVSCDDTLSTKGSIFHRQLSRDIVDKPGGVMRKRLPEIGEIRTDQSSSSSSTERQSKSHIKEKLVDNIVLNNEIVSRQQLVDEQSYDEQDILDDDNHSLVEYKCDRMLESLDGNQSLVEYQCDDVPEEETKERNASLPYGWEAILEEDSGEYYYTNWDTGFTTWDRPDEVTSNSDMHNEKDAADVSLCMDNQRGFKESNASINNHSGHVYFADEDSVDSAIAALNRWNGPVGIVEDEEEVMAWSDDDEEKDAFDLSPKPNVRRQRNPWNKRDDESVDTMEWK